MSKLDSIKNNQTQMQQEINSITGNKFNNTDPQDQNIQSNQINISVTSTLSSKQLQTQHRIPNKKCKNKWTPF